MLGLPALFYNLLSACLISCMAGMWSLESFLKVRVTMLFFELDPSLFWFEKEPGSLWLGWLKEEEEK